MKGKMVGAHRVSYELYVSSIPENLQVLHRCDVPCCVNPNHLFIGTQPDNMHDMKMKGRANRNATFNRGDKQGSAKLNREQVLSIRSDTRTHKEIAKEHHIHHEYVKLIKTKRRWAWL